ncbi:MAG: hypothetical protein CME65_09370 [Halobacteriovoraceae bacterium]|nr:hypothetical protein [Halobacteriovoraceae bacterium]
MERSHFISSLPNKFIKIRGARVNNLKGVDVDIPLKKLTCFTGPSGSGKTSLAFQTIYSESKRRFINSFPTSVKFFIERPAPVDVDSIEPVLPVFGLPQINPVVGTRSNVADVMHLTGLFQNFFGNYSKELCPDHLEEFKPQLFRDYLCSEIPEKKRDGVFHIFIEKEEFIEKMVNTPFPTRSLKSNRSRKITDFDKDHLYWEVFRFKFDKLDRAQKKYEELEKLGLKFFVFSESLNKITPLHYRSGYEYYCPEKGCEKIPSGFKNNIMSFSPYNALGACDKCNGFGETLEYDPNKLWDEEKSVAEGGVSLLNYKRFSGQLEELISEMKASKISIKKPIKELPKKFFELLYEGSGDYYGFNAYFSYLERKKYKMNVRIFVRNLQKGEKCQDCQGSRLGSHVQQFFAFKDLKLTLADLMDHRLEEVYNLLQEHNSDRIYKSTDANKSYKRLLKTLGIAIEMGLGHLSLARKSKSLSAGEYQRLLLLKYLSYDGTGALFIFDEPSLGLSQKEMKALLDGFRELIEKGNTVILIDHDDYMLNKSDYVIEIGPQGGHKGGELIYQGEVKKFKPQKSQTKLKPLKLDQKKKLALKGAEIFGKSYPDVEIAIGGINSVVGPSGSGKTSCLINILADGLTYKLTGEHLNLPRGKFKHIDSPVNFEDVIVVDANLNRYTSRSTVGSMTGFFPVFRKHFVATPMAQAMGLVEGHLSYNSDLGQCPKCEGKGHTVVEMQFLEDIVLECEDCQGRKLKPLFADVSDGTLTVHEAYSRPLAETIQNIRLTPKFERIFEHMKLLNLDYLSLDRKITSLSGGEKQRIYLLNRLQKKINNSIIFFENISFGLSIVELEKLCLFLQDLTKSGNTIVVIDQNPIFEKIANNKINFN